MLLAGSLCLTILIAQTPANNSGPTISLAASALRYPTSAHSISQVEYGELKVEVGSKRYQLHQGEYLKRYKPTGLDQLRLVDHWLIKGTNGNPKYAVLHLEHLGVGGSSSITTYVQVLSLVGKALSVNQELRFIPLAMKGQQAVSFDPVQGLLVVSARSDDDSPNCCPQSIDVASYQWDGSQFRLIEWQAKPYTKPN